MKQSAAKTGQTRVDNLAMPALPPDGTVISQGHPAGVRAQRLERRHIARVRCGPQQGNSASIGVAEDYEENMSISDGTGSPPELIRTEFARRVSYWEDVYGNSVNSDHDSKMRLQLIVDCAKECVPRQDVPVLDVGCGVGVCLQELARTGYRNLVGTDITPEMIDRARALWSSRAPAMSSAQWIVSDLESLPAVLPNGIFTLVICAGLFEYLPDDRTSLAILKTMLADGGYLILTIPNRYAVTPLQLFVSVKRIWNRHVPRWLRIPSAAAYHRRQYSLSAFVRLARNEGFEAVNWMGHGHYVIPSFMTSGLVKMINEILGGFLDRLGTRSGFQWIQRAGSNFVVVFRNHG